MYAKNTIPGLRTKRDPNDFKSCLCTHSLVFLDYAVDCSSGQLKCRFEKSLSEDYDNDKLSLSTMGLGASSRIVPTAIDGLNEYHRGV